MGVDYEKKDHIAYITINNPDVMNSLYPADMERLIQIWEDFRDDDALRVAVLTGTGDKSFCAGANLRELIPKVVSGDFKISPSMPACRALLKNLPLYKPIIAAVNGYCIAGGVEVLLGTDLRIAVEHATFGLAEARWALYPGAGATVRLPRQIPYCRAMEIMLLGEPVSAQEALAMGLINKIVKKEELMDHAKKMAQRICDNGPLSVRAIKESVQRSYEVPIEYAYILETYFALDVYATEDAKEGPRAFAEKRKPVYKGK